MAGRITIDNFSERLIEYINSCGLKEEQVVELINQLCLNEGDMKNLLNNMNVEDLVTENKTIVDAINELSEKIAGNKDDLINNLNDLTRRL
jgi:hypothetical protein